MRSTLLAALVGCADKSRRPTARRFLVGLSADEMQFIAEFLGASILEPHVTWKTQGFRARCAPDRNHKLLVLSEFLRRANLQKTMGPATGRSSAGAPLR